MVVTITQFRRDLFSLVENAVNGEVVEFTHRGVRFRIVPEGMESKLGRISPLHVVNPDTDLPTASRELLSEMQAEWEKDWSEIA